MTLRERCEKLIQQWRNYADDGPYLNIFDQGQRDATDRRADELESALATPEPSETDLEPYFVEVDENGCAKCGAGRMWTVIDPDGYALGESWGGEEGEEHAASIAEWMNMAFAAGVDTEREHREPKP